MEVEKGKKRNMILGKERRVSGIVLTPLTPFNSLTPHQSYESAVLS